MIEACPGFRVGGLAVLLGMLVLAGCSGNPRVQGPQVDPQEVAARFIESYDLNGDGVLSSTTELKNCSALAESVRAYDQDSDGEITHSELSQRLADVYSDRIAIFSLSARVTLDGRPLRGALVRLSPEEAFDGALAVAEGETNSKGYTTLSVGESDLPSDLRGIVRGVQSGLYRIQIEHNSKSLPDDVVSGDRFGAEVTPGDGNSGISFNIK